jgi:hypothetical protein
MADVAAIVVTSMGDATMTEDELLAVIAKIEAPPATDAQRAKIDAAYDRLLEDTPDPLAVAADGDHTVHRWLIGMWNGSMGNASPEEYRTYGRAFARACELEADQREMWARIEAKLAATGC